MSINHKFWRERRAEAESNQGLSAYQPNALPLGQTVHCECLLLIFSLCPLLSFLSPFAHVCGCHKLCLVYMFCQCLLLTLCSCTVYSVFNTLLCLLQPRSSYRTNGTDGMGHRETERERERETHTETETQRDTERDRIHTRTVIAINK